MAARKKEATQADFDNLKDELQVSLLAAEDIKALRAKVSTLVIRLREEKEEKLKISTKHDVLKRKVEMLADHLEKLMNHLRIESKQKCRIVESRRSLRKELSTMRDIADRQQKIIESKNRYISEICEGSKLLEDQLRLMDDKYLEMRKKLDFAREQGRVEVGRAERTASSLRRKFQQLTGSTKLLDRCDVPECATSGPESRDPRGVSWADFSESGRGPSPDPYGQSTKPLVRVRSAPSRRNTGMKPAGLQARPDPPVLDDVLSKIERKRAELEGTKWDEQKMKNLLASSEEAVRPKTGQKKGRPTHVDTVPEGSQAQDQDQFLRSINFNRPAEISPSNRSNAGSHPPRASSFAVLDY